MASLFGKIARGVTSVAKAVTKVPVLGTAVRALPGVGLGLGALEVGSAIYGATRGRGAGVPGLPMLPGTGGPFGMGLIPPTGGAAMMGKRSIFRDDPNVIEMLKPYAIPARALRQSYRAPKGFIVRYDSAGDPYGIPKFLAKQFFGWKPARKPPISVGDWNKLAGADRVIRKFRDMEKKAMRIANFRAPRKKGGMDDITKAIANKAANKAIAKAAAA